MRVCIRHEQQLNEKLNPNGFSLKNAFECWAKAEFWLYLPQEKNRIIRVKNWIGIN